MSARLTDPDPRLGWRLTVAVVAVAFGFATILAGGRVLFGPDSARKAVGDYVPFVVWFNFAAGFAYVAAGVGIALGRRFAVLLSVSIAVTTAIAFAALSVHVLSGGKFELRTIVTMTLRTGLWGAIALATYRRLGCLPPGTR